MDAVNRYIESLEREMSAMELAVAPSRNDIAAFLVEPFDTTCRQGAFQYNARALAQRGTRIFFIAYPTQQYGVGLWDGAQGIVEAATQFLTPEAAVRTFLVDES